MKKNLLLIFFTLSEPAFGHKGHSHDKQEDKPAAEAKLEVAVDGRYEAIRASYEKDVAPIFKRACFDCHSSETRYPWYSGLPFVNKLIENDIAEARKHLDMTEGFPFKGHGSPIEDIEAIEEDIRNGDMPPFKYRFMHWQANLSDADREKILTWTRESSRKLKKSSAAGR